MNFKGMGRVITVAAITSVLAACGGGGGGGSSAPQEQAQRVAITQTNASPVAAEAMDASSAGFVTESASASGVQVSEAAAPVSVMSSLATAVRLGLNTTTPSALVGATVTRIGSCTNGGTVTVTATFASQSVVTPGDRADLTFNNCVEGRLTFSGGLSVSFASVNSALTLIVADVAASGFTATASGIGERLNGGMRLTIDGTNSTKAVVAVTGGSFTFDRLVNGIARATRTLSNYNYRIETTTATGSTAETFSFSASGSFARIGTVSFDVQTTQPVVTPSGALHPSSGAGKVTGANGSSVTVTVISTGVRLDIDTNGDSVIDATSTRTWAELSGEL